jgi:tight adherence protein B
MLDPKIVVAVGLTVLLGAGFVAHSVVERRRRAARARLASIVPTKTGDDEQAVLVTRGSDRRSDVGGRIMPGLHDRLQGLLASAGGRLTLLPLILASLFSAGAVLGLALGPLGLSPFLTVALCGAAAAGGPMMLFARVRSKFRQQFLDLFPDALDLIVRAVKAGLPALEALVGASRDIGEPVGPVLQAVINEMRIGVEMEDALLRAADRLQIPDFRFFVVCLSLQKRTGGSLAETLSNLSTVIRKRKDLRLRARALSSEARASALVLSILPVISGGLIFILSPKYMQVLLFEPRGRFILTMAVLSLVTGLSLMNWIIKRSLR